MLWDVFVYDGDPTDGIGGPCLSESSDLPSAALGSLLVEFRERMESGLIDEFGQTWSLDCVIVINASRDGE